MQFKHLYDNSSRITDFNAIIHNMLYKHDDDTIKSVNQRIESLGELIRVYLDITLTDAQKVEMAERFDYEKVEEPVSLPTDEQRQQMSKFTDELIEQLLVAANDAVTRDRDRLADIQQQLEQSEYNVRMLQGEMKQRKENNRV